MSQKGMDFFMPNSEKIIKTLFSFIIFIHNNFHIKIIFIKNNPS